MFLKYNNEKIKKSEVFSTNKPRYLHKTEQPQKVSFKTKTFTQDLKTNSNENVIRK